MFESRLRRAEKAVSADQGELPPEAELFGLWRTTLQAFKIMLAEYPAAWAALERAIPDLESRLFPARKPLPDFRREAFSRMSEALQEHPQARAHAAEVIRRHIEAQEQRLAT